MTLRERQGELETVHPDKEELYMSQWAKILDINPSNFSEVAYKAGVKGKRHRNEEILGHPLYIPIGDFPRIIDALTAARRRRDKWQYPHIDTSHDFQFTTRSGTILIYEYPIGNKIGNFLRNTFGLGLRRP